MKKQVPAYLLKKYLKGDCTPEEKASVEEWYNSFEGDVNHLSYISSVQKQNLKDRIKHRIDDNVELADIEVQENKRMIMHYFGYALSGIAATLLIAFIFIHNQAKRTTANTNLITVTNTTKNISEQTLSDGSHVWMMPGAQIKYKPEFAANKREINLTGESFFEVTKNPARPFIIYSGNLITKVWGTSFRVRDSKDLSFADVTVMTGKVSVKLIHPGTLHNQGNTSLKPTDEVMIYPNQQVIYNKKQELFKEKPKADMQGLMIWKKESISFDNIKLKEVIPVLNKTFNVNITVADEKINTYLLNADFNGLNLPEIMEIMHKALDVNYEIQGQQVILKQANNQ